jgi:D-glycero-alpha-D-manno-heptose 1-phosphate guanylyltransferase
VHALILAGGLGTRLRELVPDRPKALAPICGRPFIEYQLNSLREAGVDRVTLCVGHLATMIENHVLDGERFGLSVTYSREDTPLGTGGAVRQAASFVDAENFIVTNGDTYLDFDPERFLNRHQTSDAAVTVALTPIPTLEMGAVHVSATGRVTHFLEKQDGPEAEKGFANAGVYAMDRSAVTLWPEGPASLEHDYLPGLAQEGRVSAEMVADRFYDIGTPAGINRFENEIVRGQKSDVPGSPTP